MKKYTCLALALVLTTGLLVGCGCTNQKMDNTSAPTVLPTNEEIWNSTEATTRSTTEATTHSTEPSSTIDRGNGPLEDDMTGSTGSTETTEGGTQSRSRSGMTGGAGSGNSGMVTGRMR